LPVAKTLRAAALRAARPLTAGWRPYSRLFLVPEDAGWVIDEEVRALAGIAGRAGVRVAPRSLLRAARRQAVFYGSHFTLFDGPWAPSSHRIGTTYFHGRPGTPGEPVFDAAFASLRAHHEELSRIQVSHRAMRDVVLESGIDPAKVFLIPIAVDASLFTPQAPELRRAARTELGLPQDAFVVGSFQKDGVGWGEGREPKLIKGPDVLVEALARVHREVPELHVLLSGPARGYVTGRLDELGIPYVHRLLDRYADVAQLYLALDAYVVPARQEGGPKGMLEAMASGVPLVSTTVGQVADLVDDGVNGWLVPVADDEALAERLAYVASRPAELPRVIDAGAATAAANTYEAHDPLWQMFFDGFVERG
jgi:glycosyltransferase involved in cell wall biosynthesis